MPARAYLDVTAETHGEKQKAFDRMYALFRELHERVQKEGDAGEGAGCGPDREAERGSYEGRFPGKTVNTRPITPMPTSSQRVVSQR